tara:strand:+ start:1101 stop:1277 length:177 start_codon:yes stop_codon:yes gene_type:complete
MQLSKNTSAGRGKNFLIKVALILAIVTVVIVLLGKIDFPSPNKLIEKIIPNDKIKIVK